MPTFSSRKFKQKLPGAKKATVHGPVYITVRGTPRYVLMTIEDYHRLVQGGSIVELLSMPEIDDIDFESTKVDAAAHPADLT